MNLRKIGFAVALTFAAVGLLVLDQSQARAGQAGELKPEKNKLEVAIAATGPLYLPVLLANEAGYFAKRGLTVNLSTLSATASVQALLSGQVDIYQGGTATIHGNVGGSDLIYIAASVDRSTLILFGQKGLTTFEALKGKSVATTSVGAFGEIAMRKTAKERGMEMGKDIKLLYHKAPSDALSTFLVGNADGVIITPPQTEMARSKGFPIIIDYYEKGLKIIGPGTGVARAFMQKNPNTLKIFLMGYLDGVKRSLDDPAYAKTYPWPKHKNYRGQAAGRQLSGRRQSLEQRYDGRSGCDQARARTVHRRESRRARSQEVLRQHLDSRGQSRLRREIISRPS